MVKIHHKNVLLTSELFTSRVLTISLKGKATLKENIIKMKDILFPNILVQVSYKSVEK